MAIKIKNGLDLPIAGPPVQAIKDGPEVTQVALVGDDYIGMKPTLLVNEGDSVKLGQPVFQDKKTPGVTFVAPAAGKVHSINRGAKRKFLSMIFDVDGDAAESFKSYDSLNDLDAETVQEQLVTAGMWQSFRTRPYSKVPELGTEPNSCLLYTSPSPRDRG